MRRWPSAKFMSDKWQNKILPANFYFLNGKSVIALRRVFSFRCLPAAKQNPRAFPCSVCYTDHNYTIAVYIERSIQPAAQRQAVVLERGSPSSPEKHITENNKENDCAAHTETPRRGKLQKPPRGIASLYFHFFHATIYKSSYCGFYTFTYQEYSNERI